MSSPCSFFKSLSSLFLHSLPGTMSSDSQVVTTPRATPKRKASDNDNLEQRLLRCSGCEPLLPIENFNLSTTIPRGRHYTCRDCLAKYNAARRCTLKGAFSSLLYSAKTRAKQRGERGRVEAAVFTLTMEDMYHMYERQDDGCCHYYRTKVMSILPNTCWQMSLERLNPSKGYTIDNCVLCCQEFNDRRTLSWPKIRRMVELRSAEFDMGGFLTAVHDEGQTRKCPHGPNTERYRNGKGNCKACIRDYNKEYRTEEFKRQQRNSCQHEDGMGRDKRGRCKLCLNEETALRACKPHGFIHRMLGLMTSNSKQRNHPPPEHTFDDLVNLATTQTGRCSFSGLPMSFAAKTDFAASPERLNPRLHYSLSNVVLICTEFNTTCNRKTKSGKVDDINSQMSKEKVDEWFTYLESVEGLAYIESQCSPLGSS